MPSYQSLKDDALLAESYYDNVQTRLLLETPATKANIDRFIKKYFDNDIFNPPGLTGDRAAMQRAANEHGARGFLDKWTPRLQQIIKAAGGNPDIFAYSSLAELQRVIENSQSSKTDEKKAYKAASDVNIPIVQETDKYIVYQPLTWEASRKYFGVERISLLDGELKKGSNWCTAASKPGLFNKYVNKEKSRLIYFIRKKDDKLFAARSTVGASDEGIYQQWLRKVAHTLKAIDKIKAGEDYIAAQKSKDKWEIERAERSIVILALDLVPRQLIEIRDQKNSRIFRLLDFYITLNKKDPDMTQYITFIKFVVFGKTD